MTTFNTPDLTKGELQIISYNRYSGKISCCLGEEIEISEIYDIMNKTSEKKTFSPVSWQIICTCVIAKFYGLEGSSECSLFSNESLHKLYHVILYGSYAPFFWKVI